ncbi:putative E3 ubiquitin-protein ligase XBAT35 isoform X2 [Durio zibethinus]|uniref:E3 ubiquitin-protein ligase XBAT35 isoform X2 n=1 Tax=Durio zibethinus TaxID=66656 RepID=A0A6P6A5P4_DURZI|nr:putative E3 ubiquitin-protein ligase XBAT35 isoform X2 [Durio zibethinus]
MGQQQSKDELLYNQVSYGNTEGIKALRREGAGLEWIDREGKTPLILACLNPEHFNVAKTLIELGANVNAYRPANPLVMNDDCQTPLDVAREKRTANVVRAIEDHICLFSGWMREFYGPAFIEMFVPQLVSRKVWVVVLPTGSRNQTKPFKLELAIYSSLQDAQPRTVIALWKADLEEPKLNQPDPSVAILDNSSISRRGRRRRSIYTSREARCKPGIVRRMHVSRRRRRRRSIYTSREARCKPGIVRRMHETRIKLAPGNENDRQQLLWFCDACKGIPQATGPAFLHNPRPPAASAPAPPDAEDLELAMAINASIQSAIAETPNFDLQLGNEASSSTSWSTLASSSSHGGSVAPTAYPPSKASISEWTMTEAGTGSHTTAKTQNDNNSAAHITVQNSDSVPSAPPAVNEIVENGPIQYPSIDTTPIDMSYSDGEKVAASPGQTKEDGGPASCTICLDAPCEAACVPCGHVAGCMSCLNEIKAKKWGCPVCRAKIEQVIKLYRV